ncbi:MAG: 3-oxoacyl-[acyl-carrier-protein] reductase [Bacteroides sp.]
MKLLEGKTAIVTGGTRGIGRGIVRLFAEEGANVVFTARNPAFEEVEQEAAAFGVRAKGFTSDASDFAQAEALVEATIAEFGGVDILVNNAGITRDTLLMRMTEEQWDEVLRVNLKSVFNMTKAVQRTMLKQKQGTIVNISSVVGVSGNAGQANYAASKAGIIGFSKSIAKELGARNIRTNVVAPGFIETEMTEKLPEEIRKGWADQIPLKRAGTPLDVARAVLFLASDLSSYVNGQVLNVCGGMNM